MRLKWQLLRAQPIIINMQYVITYPTSTEAYQPHHIFVSQFAPFYFSWGHRIQTQQIGIRSLYCLCHKAALAEESCWLGVFKLPSCTCHKHNSCISTVVRSQSLPSQKESPEGRRSIHAIVCFNTFLHSKTLRIYSGWPGIQTSTTAWHTHLSLVYFLSFNKINKHFW